jgi:phosphoglycolate phosphatase
VTNRAVLLDLDGTLTDPREGIVCCIRHALERLDRPAPPDDVLAACIGPPLRGTFATLLATADPVLIERAMTLYRRRFGEVGLYENEAYAGAHALWRRRATCRRRLSACSLVELGGLEPAPKLPLAARDAPGGAAAPLDISRRS